MRRRYKGGPVFLTLALVFFFVPWLWLMSAAALALWCKMFGLSCGFLPMGMGY